MDKNNINKDIIDNNADKVNNAKNAKEKEVDIEKMDKKALAKKLDKIDKERIKVETRLAKVTLGEKLEYFIDEVIQDKTLCEQIVSLSDAEAKIVMKELASSPAFHELFNVILKDSPQLSALHSKENNEADAVKSGEDDLAAISPSEI